MAAKKHIIVTGGAGFIGSNIARTLVNQNYRVTILDNLSTGRVENFRDIRRQVTFIKGDILNARLLERVFLKADYVLHEAALPSVPRSINNPRASHDVNVNGTFNILMAARKSRIKKVVLASSSSIYGNRKNFGTRKIKYKKEVMKPMPLSPYAVNKLIDEEYAKVFSHIFNVPTVCLRYFNVFGPGQNPNSEYAAVIPRFITSMMSGRRPVIFGDGRQSRDFTYIDSVVHANILAMTSERVNLGETLNIACGESISLLRLVSAINKTIKKDIQPKFESVRAGDVKHSLADISKAKRLIGYIPLVPFHEGLRRTINWYQNQ